MVLRATAFETSRTDLPLQPIDPTWIKEGAPVARAIVLTESPDKNLTSGIWDCTAGTFTWIFYRDEIVHIVEGEVLVHDNGKVHRLVPGSVAYFPCGLETVWEVPRYVKKAYVLREPHVSRLRRTAQRAKSVLKTVLGRPT